MDIAKIRAILMVVNQFLNLALSAAEAMKGLADTGIQVPEMDEFRKNLDKLKNLPNLTQM